MDGAKDVKLNASASDLFSSSSGVTESLSPAGHLSVVLLCVTEIPKTRSEEHTSELQSQR